MRRSIMTNLRRLLALTLIIVLPVIAAAQGRQSRAQSYDVIIKGGTVYDGTGRAGRRADVGIKGDRIAAVGSLKGASATTLYDAS